MVKGVASTSRAAIKKPDNEAIAIENISSNQDSGNITELLQMQQHLIQNPLLMQRIISTPMVESLLKDPDMIRQLLTNNPQMQALIKQNPVIGDALNDPEALLRSIRNFSHTSFASEQEPVPISKISPTLVLTSTSTDASSALDPPQNSKVDSSIPISEQQNDGHLQECPDIYIHADDRADILLESLLQGDKQQSEILQEVVLIFVVLNTLFLFIFYNSLLKGGEPLSNAEKHT